jgi:uncharacterized phage protein gp47/JayE
MITIPTISQLYSDIVADIEAEYGESIPTIGKAFLPIIAGAQAAKLWLQYKAIGLLQKNIFIDTADRESSGGTLERFGRIKLNRNPRPAVAGQYSVTVTGTIGATINAKTTFKSNDDTANPGMLFILDVAHVMATVSENITLRALQSGVDSKLEVGNELTATIPLVNIDQAVTVASETIEPQAEENIEDYRNAGIEAYRLEPQGGAPSDFRLWARDAQGVAQSYPYARTGFSAEVNLYVEATIADSTDGKGTPSAGLLTDVEAVVELDPDTSRPLSERGRRPLGVFEVHYLAVSPLDVDIDIADFENLTVDDQTLIELAITELLAAIRPFVAGADVLADKNDILNANKIVAKIFNTIPNAEFGDVTLTVDGNIVSSFVFDEGFIPYLNSITYS